MKKGVKIAVIIIAAVLALALLGIAVLFLSGNQITVARCIVTENGGLYMVYDERPVRISAGEGNDFQTGDKILIVHASAFAESYPEQARTICVMKIGSGTKDDIPQKAFDVLIETGNYSVSDVGGVDGPSNVTVTPSVGEMPENTSLEFWITEDVKDRDWTGHDEIYGWMGAREFLGSGYKKNEDPTGSNQHPEHYVSYVITAWPDYADGGEFVTDITVTDPAVMVYGLTIESTYEEFDAVFESLGYELSWGEGAIKTRVATRDGITFRLTRAVEDNPDVVPVFSITAEVTNREGIVF